MQLRGPLEAEGYTILEASSGVEGLSLISAYKEPISLIITDQNMPNKTGTEMVSAIRKLTDNPNRNCPVVFLTSDSSPQIRDACVNLGAKAIVLKPVKPDALAGAVKKILEKSTGT